MDTPTKQHLYEVFQALADILREMVSNEADVEYYKERFREMHACLTLIAQPKLTTDGEWMFEVEDMGIRLTVKFELYTVGDKSP